MDGPGSCGLNRRFLLRGHGVLACLLLPGQLPFPMYPPFALVVPRIVTDLLPSCL
jgi:hypothetical protein